MYLICSAFKFGEFTLKSGEISPIYFDLRVIVAHPDVMEQLTNLMSKFIEEKEISFDQLCGVPYTGKKWLFARNTFSDRYHLQLFHWRHCFPLR